MLFVVRCHGEPPERPVCDLADPSRAILVQIRCDDRLVTFELPLEDSAVTLGPSACVLNSAISPYALHCKDSSSPFEWSAWMCIPARGAEILRKPVADVVDGTSCLKLAEPRGVLAGLSPCFHRDRFLIRAVACMDADCAQTVASDDVFELQFEHPSGMRAARCLTMPSRSGVTAGIAVAAVVGGTIAIGLGSSLGASVRGAQSKSTSDAGFGTAARTMSLLRVTQFMGLISDMCAVQGSEKWQLFEEIMQALNCFNFRVPVPAFVTEWSVVFGGLSICGMDPVDLAAQARADIGDLFSGNVFFGIILLAILVTVHLLLLQPTPVFWRRFIQRKAPFGQLELQVLVICVQGVQAWYLVSCCLP